MPVSLESTACHASQVLTKEEESELEAKTREIFDPIAKVYDDRKRRVTDLKECSRITLPKPLPPAQEAALEIRRNSQQKIYEKYREKRLRTGPESY